MVRLSMKQPNASSQWKVPSCVPMHRAAPRLLGTLMVDRVTERGAVRSERGSERMLPSINESGTRAS